MVSFRFFRERIEDEEFQLIRFFGQQYVQYQARVPAGATTTCNDVTHTPQVSRSSRAAASWAACAGAVHASAATCHPASECGKPFYETHEAYAKYDHGQFSICSTECARAAMGKR